MADFLYTSCSSGMYANVAEKSAVYIFKAEDGSRNLGKFGIVGYSGV
jgi:hypothetical protein